MDTVLTVGRYGIDEWLASGAMGVVFRGYDPVLDRPVAIKILRRELAKGGAAEGWNNRFKGRARAAGRLFHANIVTTLDFGEDHDIPYLVMEYIDGSSLDRLLEISGPLPPQRAVAIILQVLSALKYSHENAVVHLDIKPSIVFVLANGHVKVADFGTAPVDAIEPTSIGEPAGPPTSLAPELLTGAPVDHRTDLFAAGAVLFEMLACSKPFRGGSVAEIVTQIETRGPEDVCVLNPEVPSALRDILNRALAYDPGQRFATASAFAHALTEAVSAAHEAEAVRHAPPSAAAIPGALLLVDEAGWDPEALRVIEADLARHIGPVAAVAVKRAAKRSNDLVDIYGALAVHIENGKDRDEFLARGRRVTAANSDRIAFPPAENSSSEATAARPADPPEPETVDAIEAQLARHVGPIAKFLVKQQLQSFESLPQLYRTLAEHISDEGERTAFLNLGRAG